jgi:tetratricopeptide (TPR) repeat protein
MLGLSVGLVLFLASPAAAGAFAVEVGEPLPDDELPTLAGPSARLLGQARASVFVFVRTGQEQSLDVLTRLGGLEKQLAGKPVRFVAVASGDEPAAALRALAKQAGFEGPVLLDRGDALYGKLGVRLHPVIGIADGKRRLVAYEHFTKINFIDVIRARVRRQLGEITDAQLEAVLHPPEQQADDAEKKAAERRVKLARTLLRIKDFEKAMHNAREAAAKAPSLASAHEVMGEILAAQGMCPDASKEFAEALRLDPSDAAAKDGQQACSGK